MKCKHCGEEIANDSMFCEHCGQQLVADKSKRNRTILLICGIALVVACVVTTLFFVLHYGNMEKGLGELTAAPTKGTSAFADNPNVSFSGHVLAQSNRISSGEEYKANFMVAAFDPSMPMDVYYMIGADTLTEVQLGEAEHISGTCAGVELSLPSGGVGQHRIAGLIKAKAPSGEDKYYPFKQTYFVTPKGGATISADKMNVLYAGISNPITLEGGVGSNYSVTIPSCTVKTTGTGTYNVTVPSNLIGKFIEATISSSDGSFKKGFRVKKVPDPYAQIGINIFGGRKSKAELTANPVLRVKMSEDFAFDLRWTVVSYSVDVIEKGIISTINCSGSKFSSELINRINSAPTGTVFMFYNIKISQPELGTRTMTHDITVRIK